MDSPKKKRRIFNKFTSTPAAMPEGPTNFSLPFPSRAPPPRLSSVNSSRASPPVPSNLNLRLQSPLAGNPYDPNACCQHPLLTFGLRPPRKERQDVRAAQPPWTISGPCSPTEGHQDSQNVAPRPSRNKSGPSIINMDDKSGPRSPIRGHQDSEDATPQPSTSKSRPFAVDMTDSSGPCLPTIRRHDKRQGRMVKIGEKSRPPLPEGEQRDSRASEHPISSPRSPTNHTKDSGASSLPIIATNNQADIEHEKKVQVGLSPSFLAASSCPPFQILSFVSSP